MRTNERNVLRYIIEFKKTNGYAPTTREISAGCYVSERYVRVLLGILEDDGYIRKQAGKARTVEVLRFI